MQTRNGKELKVGTIVNVPFRVVRVVGQKSAALAHLETVEAYGHENPNAPEHGRTRTAFWAEPRQVDSADSKELAVDTEVKIPFRVTKLGGRRAPLVHLETVHGYGHEDPNAPGPLKGKVRAGFWAEPDQLDAESE